MCKAIQDLMDDSKAEGKELGIAEGKELGIAEGKELALLETAYKLLDVLSDDVISEKTGLSLEKVQELRVNFHNRPL